MACSCKVLLNDKPQPALILITLLDQRLPFPICAVILSTLTHVFLVTVSSIHAIGMLSRHLHVLKSLTPTDNQARNFQQTRQAAPNCPSSAYISPNLKTEPRSETKLDIDTCKPMPHATDDMSSQTTSNGEQPSSKFINHVTSYPVVNDSIETFKQNPYGKKSLEIADGAYQKFGKPVEPYLQTPYSYAKPYVSKADELADSGLGSVESRFPIVKEDTHTVVDTAKSYAFWPFSYVLSTWDGKPVFQRSCSTHS